MTVLLAQLVVLASAFLPERSRARFALIDGTGRAAHRRLA